MKTDLGLGFSTEVTFSKVGGEGGVVMLVFDGLKPRTTMLPSLSTLVVELVLQEEEAEEACTGSWLSVTAWMNS